MTNNNSLLERQAEFVYNGARIAAIAAKAPIVPVIWSEREEIFRTQFLKVIERQSKKAPKKNENTYSYSDI